MAILTRGIPAATAVRVRSVLFDPGRRRDQQSAVLNVECDLVSLDAAGIATVVQPNYYTLALSGADAVEFWKQYDSDAVLEARIVSDLKARGVTATPDVSYLPDGRS